MCKLATFWVITNLQVFFTYKYIYMSAWLLPLNLLLIHGFAALSLQFLGLNFLNSNLNYHLIIQSISLFNSLVIT